MTIFYELIDEICIVFLFLLQSLFSANENAQKIFLVNAKLFFVLNFTGNSVIYEELAQKLGSGNSSSLTRKKCQIQIVKTKVPKSDIPHILSFTPTSPELKSSLNSISPER